MGSKFQKWYRDHGKTLNEKRRERFASDPDYATRVREQRRESDRRAAEAKRQARKLQRPRIPTAYDEAVDSTTGQREKGVFFTISEFAKALGVTPQTVRLWERSEKIERTRYRSTSGYRLYPLEYIEKKADERGTLKSTPVRRLPRGVRQRTRKTASERYCLGSYRLDFRSGEERDEAFFSVGLLCHVLGISTNWHGTLVRKKRLPDTPFKIKGRRAYTLGMIEAAASAQNDHSDWTDLHRATTAAWTDAGYTTATLRGAPDQRAQHERPDPTGPE